MSKKKSNNKPPSGEPWEIGEGKRAEYGERLHFARVFNSMTDSPAWQALSPQARMVYLALKMNYGGPKYTPGQIVRADQRFIHQFAGVGSRYVSDYLLELEMLGFLERIHGRSRRKAQQVRLIGEWVKYGEAEARSRKAGYKALRKEKHSSE